MEEHRAPSGDGGAAAATDPLTDDPRLPGFFGPAWPAVSGFHRMLQGEGVLRGLVGPREVGRLWERHLLNSAAVVPFLPAVGTIVDLGSGAGMPGVVAAAMRPEARVVLLEPMLRRTEWLGEVVRTLGLDNVEVHRGRAEEVVGTFSADAVTVRAVAALDVLYGWAMPLLRVGGELVALKGARAEEEIGASSDTGRAWGAGVPAVHTVGTVEGVESTRVVTVVRERAVAPPVRGGVAGQRKARRRRG
ncbi:16S rRNA (guanine(527)-N(7))-methyltransferase RsmG [Cellulomonas marina]|uniref:Ribosomal RNA small subunit methyltransferase G n=1 Tax=Cellulomonas marina TaxID=988821 RepID=A0A1I1AD85_9CELL|nr:16S rRNA (guanine(527)-N(7))-methyltransferase RsmG [Cellulomonas marina]GIG30569.1 ribosomal RNA small subunit methyltransferase G [Cellulomonas marina]SFB34478.1 16S rRNA (guanine527-N7)-methyltransferase [Cellulomonas marina]